MMSCGSCAVNNRKGDSAPESWKGRGLLVYNQRGLDDWSSNKPTFVTMPQVAFRSVSHRLTPSPVQESNYNFDRHPHARGDHSHPYPSLGNVMDRSATADPVEGFTDIGGGSGCAFRFRKAN
jgi:hypothetical protein